MQCYPRSKCREVMTGTDDQGKPNNKTRMQADCRAIQTADSKDLQCSWMEIGADFECIEKGYANEELGDDLDFKATGECKFNQQYFEFQGLGSSIGVSGIFPLGFAFRVSLFPLCALRFVFGVWRLAFGVWRSRPGFGVCSRNTWFYQGASVQTLNGVLTCTLSQHHSNRRGLQLDVSFFFILTFPNGMKIVLSCPRLSLVVLLLAHIMLCRVSCLP